MPFTSSMASEKRDIILKTFLLIRCHLPPMCSSRLTPICAAFARHAAIRAIRLTGIWFRVGEGMKALGMFMLLLGEPPQELEYAKPSAFLLRAARPARTTSSYLICLCKNSLVSS